MKRYLFLICFLVGCSDKVEVWNGPPSGHYREITINGEKYFQIKRPGEDWVTCGKFIDEKSKSEGKR